MLSAILCMFCSVELPVLTSGAEFLIGEPIVCTVDLGALDAPPVLGEGDFEPGRAWAVIEEPVIQRGLGGARTLSWTLFALEPTPGLLPTPSLTQAGEPVMLIAPSIVVAPALGAGEDEPRPARGLPNMSPAVSTSGSGLGPLLFIGLAVLLILGIAVGLCVWLIIRGTAQAAEEESFTERVGRLRSEMTGDSARIAALHSELALILRAAHGDQRSGWSDEEWIERAELSEAQRVELRGILTSCAEVKYGGSQPTRFAVEELLDRVGVLVSSADEVAA